MKTLIMLLLSSSIAHAADESTPADKVCQAITKLSTITMQMDHQTKVEKASGVRDLDLRRSLGERFTEAVEEMLLARAEEKGKEIKDISKDCQDISKSDALRIKKHVMPAVNELKKELADE